MSLTGLINAGRGPVFEWFEARLPNTRRISTGTNRRLRAGDAAMCLVPPPPGSDTSVAAMAAEYVLAAQLRDGAFKRGPAEQGALRLASRQASRREAAIAIERCAAAVRRLSELRCEGSAPGGADWGELLSISVVMARFEQMYRAGPALPPEAAQALLEPCDDLTDLGRRLASSETLVDLDRLGRAMSEDLRHLSGHEIRFGATFAQSPALGGADCDLIADGTLYELKSLGGQKGVGRRDLWQLAGYLLCDSDDRYSIERCALVALRRRRTCEWQAQEYLDCLAADGLRGRSLGEWRDDFAEMLAGSERARDAGPPPRPASSG